MDKNKKISDLSIQSRIISNFGILILLLVTFVEFIIIVLITNYYIGGAQQILKDRVSISAEFLNRDNNYFSTEDKARSFFENFGASFQDKFLVQFIDKRKTLVIDSNGFSDSIEINTDDVNKALENKFTIFKQYNEVTGETTLSASKPLYRYNDIDGVLRFVISLEDLQREIHKLATISVSFGLIIVIVFITLSVFISRTIVMPIKKLNKTAEEFANGNFDIRAVKTYDDELGTLVETLNFMADEIKRGEKLKSDFISSISHELRTPLTSIKGWSETLLTSENYSKDSDLTIGLKIISGESERLSSMVEELLDFSRYQSGSMKIDKKPVNIKKIISDVYKQFMNNKNNLEMVISLSGEDTIILGDKNRLRQVYINIIANAIKFTDKEGGKIELKATGYEDKIVTCVKDNGAGIKPEDIPRVTEKFFKGTKAPGSGLGLSIVSEIVKLHSGTLEIESELDSGSKFIITFPAYVEKGEQVDG